MLETATSPKCTRDSNLAEGPEGEGRVGAERPPVEEVAEIPDGLPVVARTRLIVEAVVPPVVRVVPQAELLLVVPVDAKIGRIIVVRLAIILRRPELPLTQGACNDKSPKNLLSY